MRRVTTLVAAAALSCGLARAASAADLPVKYNPQSAPPAFSWSGCYAGVQVGGGWQTSSFTTNGGAASGVGWLGGAQAGCNIQWNMFVIGLEGEFWGSTLYDRNFFSNSFETEDGFSRNRWDGAISVRSGIAFDRAFLYGKLGAIWGKFDYSFDGTFGNRTSTERASAVFTGVLIGVGFEYALTNNWTAKFEYDHIDFGNKVVNFSDIECNAGVCLSTPFSLTVKERKEIAKLGLNYKFF